MANKTAPAEAGSNDVLGEAEWPLSLLGNVADQCRELGLQVGDTIEGREASGSYWHEARLTLLWLGDEVAVWRETSRSENRPDWSDPEETADWTLEYRVWRKVSLNG